MASMDRKGRNAPMSCSHGRAFSPTFACLPPSHSPRTTVVERTEIATVQQTPIARGDLAVSLALFPHGKKCIVRLQSFFYRVAKRPAVWPIFVRPGDGSTFIYPYIFPHCWCQGDREVLQKAWGLVPDGVRVLLVEAESKLIELVYRGARAGGRTRASDGMRTTCSACRTSARTPTGL